MADANTNQKTTDLDLATQAQRVAAITRDASVATLQGMRLQLAALDPSDPAYADKAVVVAKAAAVYDNAHQAAQAADAALEIANAALEDAAEKAP